MKIPGKLYPGNLSAAAKAAMYSSAGMLLIFILLECWRFPFCLTDDNLTIGYPIYFNLSRQLHHGENIFLNPYLYGGSDFAFSIDRLYHLNPVSWIVLGLMKGHEVLSIDACVFLYLLIGVIAQSFFLHRISLLAGREPSTARICFLTLASYTGIFHLIVFSSWGSWGAAAAALPWIGYGILASSWKKALALVFSGILFLFLVGDLHPFFYGMLFLGLFALAVAFCLRSAGPVLCFAAGTTAAGIVLYLLMAPALQGFSSSERAGGLSIHNQVMMLVPLPYLLVSSFWGTLSQAFFQVKPEYFYMGFPYAAGIAGSGGAWLSIPVFFKNGLRPFHWAVLAMAMLACFFLLPGTANTLLIGWIVFLLLLMIRNYRGLDLNRWEWSLLALFLLTTVFIGRPYFLAWIISHTPLYSALRWPFRELMMFHFFGAAFLACSAMRLSARSFWAWGLAGVLIMALPPFLYKAPSINPMSLDRRLILDGRASLFWNEQKILIPANTRIAVVLEPGDVRDRLEEIPFSLLGGFNYPSVFEVPAHYGYTMDGGYGTEAMRNNGKPVPFHYSGAITRADVPALLKSFPETTLVSVASFEPLRIRFESPLKSWEVDVEKSGQR